MKRCAIYTRKSTEERLDMHFNSLEAQSDACRAYIASQVHANWLIHEEEFSDPGISGGTLERPGLRKLLDLIERGEIDIVVVHKVDRLTRSLADFAKLAEQFEKYNVSFVSVTQNLDTSTSMGRLSLNVLLSFAQFEREIASDRIREKIAASRRRGLWTGGVVPLGYRSVDKQLVVDQDLAWFVRFLFQRYNDLGSVSDVMLEIESHSQQGPHQVCINQLRSQEKLPGRGSLYNLLRNPLYIGKVRCGSELIKGIHEPIIDQKLFASVQALLDRPGQKSKRSQGNAPRTDLLGKIFDKNGERLTRTHTKKPNGSRYAYYVSSASTRGKKAKALHRIPCEGLHDFIARHVLEDLRKFILSNDALQTSFARFAKHKTFSDPESHWHDKGYVSQSVRAVSRVCFSDEEILITYDALRLAADIVDDQSCNGTFIRKLKLRKPAVFEGSSKPKTQILQRSLSSDETRRQGKEWFTLLATGKAKSMYEIADRYGVSQPTVSRVISKALEE